MNSYPMVADILNDTSNSKVWVWPVEQVNWSTVREQKVWAVGKKGKGSRVKKDDKIIFYLKGRYFFVGIFNVVSDWHDRTIVWPDQQHGSIDMSTGAEIDLEIMQLGFASWAKLFNDLKFVENKSPGLRGKSLRGTIQGPANSARAISIEDFNLILEEMIQVQKEPDNKKIVQDDEFVELVDMSDYTFDMQKLPEPEKKTLDSIFKEVENGKLAIPKFQRYWTWDRQQIEELWESIFRSYYIGSLLFWNADGVKLGSTPIEGAPDTGRNTTYILDGQQRITAIYYAVKAPEKKLPKTEYPYVFFLNLNALLDPRRESSEIVDSYQLKDAKKKKYFEKEIQFKKKIFPLSELQNKSGSDWLFNFQDFLQDEEDYSKEDARDIYLKLNDILGHVWSKYEIPIIYLSKTLSDENVIKVFERINSKGTVLDVFDLLNARFALYEIDLKTEWEKVEKIHENLKKWYAKNSKIPIYVLQSISLLKTGYLRKSKLLAMDKTYKVSGDFQNKEFLKDWNEMAGFVEEAIKRVTDTQHGFGAINYSYIPYTVMIPILAALLKTIASRNDKTNCMEKISWWYWNTISSDNYSGSTDSKGEADYVKCKEWFDSTEIQPFRKTEEGDFTTTKKSSAIYKGILCLIVKKDALDFIQNDPPRYSNLEDHHIFPLSKASKYGAKNNMINSILNRTLISDKTNGWITDKDPSDYLTEIMNKHDIDEQKMRRRLETHLISSDAFDCMLKNDFEGFIKARKKSIIKEMNKNTGKQNLENPTQTAPNTPFTNKIVIRNAYESCKKQLTMVSKYLGYADMKDLLMIKNHLNVEKICLLTSKYRADDSLKSDFKDFRKEMKEQCQIICEIRVMSKSVEKEQHARYLADFETCYNSMDSEIAHRDLTDDISLCKKPKRFEQWWNESLDLFDYLEESKD